MCGNGGIELAKGEEKAELMSAFEKRNSELAEGEWKKDWHEFCISMQEMYFDVLRKTMKPDSTDVENAHFGHYLDCEAHTDVWRELFKTWNHTNEL